MNSLPYNGNYPPGYSHSEYERDEMPDTPLSKMDEWYNEFEVNLVKFIYCAYNPNTTPLSKEMNAKAHRYFEMGMKPEDASDLINDLYWDRCWEAKK